MKKINSLLTFIVLGFVFPLLPKLKLLFTPKIIVIMIACTAIVFSQPAMGAKEAKAQSATDRHSFWAILGLSIVGLVAPIIDWAYVYNAPSYFSIFSWIGVALILFGVSFRIWAIRILGKFFTATVQIQDDHQLIKAGPYTILRHPSYTGAFLAFLGSGILLEVWLGTIIAALAMGIAYASRITAEEKALTAAFGNQYQQYQKETHRLIPFVY